MVPPAFWILADTRIIRVLFKRSDFNPDKLPMPKWLVNWLQAILGSQCWCLMPSASSIRQHTSLRGVTRRHTSQQWSCATVPFQQGQASSGGQCQQPTGPSSKVCLQCNRGLCSCGAWCVFNHLCASCSHLEATVQHRGQCSIPMWAPPTG